MYRKLMREIEDNGKTYRVYGEYDDDPPKYEYYWFQIYEVDINGQETQLTEEGEFDEMPSDQEILNFVR